MRLSKEDNKGFTLIELVVVVSIIALLSAISLFAMGGVRESGRDARRKSDIAEIASALEMYKADCNAYPNTLPSPLSSFTGAVPPCSLSGNTYIQSIPDDPDTSKNYVYVSASSNRKFCVWTSLEEASPSPTPQPYCNTTCGSPPNCASSKPCNYCVINP